MTLNLEQNEIAILILAFFVTVLLIWVIRLHFRFKRLVQGSSKNTIEDSIVNIYKYIEKTNDDSKKNHHDLEILKTKIKNSPRGFGIVNFKAFNGVKSGGSNSFAVAFLNDNGSGIVLSTFHARDRVNVFSKEIENFKSTVMLTQEEEQALTKAKQSLSL